MKGATYWIEWAVVNVEFGSVMACYNLKCPTWLNYTLNLIYMFIGTISFRVGF
jgi:hypothetical protein